MENEYAIFRRFPTVAEAQEMELILNNHGIQTAVTDNIPPMDVTFSGNTLLHEYEVQIKQEDFKKAEETLQKSVDNILDEIDRDYYLFDFTDEELYDILLKSDEWSEFDYSLAQKILEERGKSIDETLLKNLKTERLADLAKPEGNQKSWIIGGYIFAFLGGFIGSIIGYSIWTAKKVLPNGEKVYSHSEQDRTHGKNIVYIGLVVLPITIIIILIKYL